ncbi:MAG: O-antigen ligase family protein [Saprospiraceae bacterium]|nr:O-antigen ligase family protein [Saprospiraceae bacterium]MCB0678311.1 O-antigen ligase family protein [Saprospiraceae bacterium]MCB0680331.1 O-antigen ligase family protein [Saprospiraceae bacterium]
MKISLNKILLYILYVYVFLTPFERILEFLYGIDTYFKPYRIAGILLLLLGFFYNIRRKGFFAFPPDRLLYIMFGYGITYTIVLYLMGKHVNLGGFANSTTQIVFFLLIHVTIKRINLTYRHMYKILNVLAAGVLINTAIVVSDFYLFQLASRVQGMTDNSNYAAVQMCMVALYFIFLILKNKFRLFDLHNLFYLAAAGFLFFGILATGSRTGLGIIVLCTAFLLVVMTDWSTKVRLVPFGLAVIAFVLVNSKLVDLASEASTFNRLQGVETDVRIPLWTAGKNAIIDTWGMGVGMAQIVYNKANFKKYMMPVDPNIANMVDSRGKALGLHSMYMEIMVEMGLIAMAIYLLYLFYLLRYQYRMYRLSGRRQEHTLLIILLSTVLLMGFTGKGIMSALFWFMYTIAGIYFIEDEPTSPEKAAA